MRQPREVTQRAYDGLWAVWQRFVPIDKVTPTAIARPASAWFCVGVYPHEPEARAVALYTRRP